MYASRTVRSANPSHSMSAAATPQQQQQRHQKLVAYAAQRFPQGVVHGPGRPVRSGQTCIIIENATDGKTYLCCIESGPQGDLTTCAPIDIVAAPPTGPEPSYPGVPPRAVRRLERRRRAALALTTGSRAGDPPGEFCKACIECGGDSCKWIEGKLYCGHISPNGMQCMAEKLHWKTDTPTPPGPSQPMSFRAGNPALFAAPPAVRSRLRRRERAQFIRGGGSGGVQRSAGCTACMSCGGKCWWDPFEKKLTCPGADPKCLANAMYIITHAGKPQPAKCPPGWVLCANGECAETPGDCGLTTPPPPSQPSSSGIRRAQAAMGGRLSNPRHGW